MFRPAHNRTDRPVLIDAEGRQLGGREWGAVDDSADEVIAAVDAGELVLYDKPFEADANPDAVAAEKAAAELEKKSTRKPRSSGSTPTGDAPAADATLEG